MREVHLYIAEDGTEFEDEQECLAYEAAQSAKTLLKGKVVLLDEYFKVIPLDNLADWENAFYIFTADTSALHDLYEVWGRDLTGLYPPDFLNGDTAGLFVYDEDYDNWYHMDNRIQSLQAIAGRAMKVVNKNL